MRSTNATPQMFPLSFQGKQVAFANEREHGLRAVWACLERPAPACGLDSQSHQQKHLKQDLLVVSPPLCSQSAFVVCHVCEVDGSHASHHLRASLVFTVTSLLRGVQDSGPLWEKGDLNFWGL